MKTNIIKVNNTYGKVIATALYACGGDDYNGWDVDVADVIRLIDGSLVARSFGVLFSVEETDYRPGRNEILHNQGAIKRGRRSCSNNKKTLRQNAIIKSFDAIVEDLPF